MCYYARTVPYGGTNDVWLPMAAVQSLRPKEQQFPEHHDRAPDGRQPAEAMFTPKQLLNALGDSGKMCENSVVVSIGLYPW